MLTKAEINLNNFEHNVSYLKSLNETSEIYPVIKKHNSYIMEKLAKKIDLSSFVYVALMVAVFCLAL